jgi:hypothetical protein
VSLVLQSSGLNAFIPANSRCTIKCVRIASGAESLINAWSTFLLVAIMGDTALPKRAQSEFAMVPLTSLFGVAILL